MRRGMAIAIAMTIGGTTVAIGRPVAILEKGPTLGGRTSFGPQQVLSPRQQDEHKPIYSHAADPQAEQGVDQRLRERDQGVLGEQDAVDDHVDHEAD